MTPQLSICVPTYNRASRLKVMLEALLPQVATGSEDVEVVVSDNASDDETRLVVESSAQFGPLRYSRNDSNLGVIRNVVKLATELARGEYIWMLGDDDLVMPDAVAQVVEATRKQSDYGVMYLNFRLARYAEHWPTTATGGYDGTFIRLANADDANHPVERWEQLVRAYNFMCTQMYVHVVRRSIWTSYWCQRSPGEPYSSAQWTWPHTFMLARSMAGKPCYYIGEPMLTSFGGPGGNSWNNEMPLVFFRWIPELLRFYKGIGVSPKEICRYRKTYLTECREYLIKLLRHEAAANGVGIGTFVRGHWLHPSAWGTLWSAFWDVQKKRFRRSTSGPLG